MKTRFTLILALMLSLSSIAQQGINYKALIKGGSGNIVTNQNITVQFRIYEGAALTNMVFEETHTPTTDSNGIIIINIGEGTVDSGSFTTINWGSDSYYLNTLIDIGSGMVSMGVTAFSAVPYALHAFNVKGLEALDEGNGIGWRLKGRDPEHYGNIGGRAVDLSFNSISSSSHGATGDYSIAMGVYTTASGGNSTSMGWNTNASGGSSLAMGSFTTASGSASIATGDSANASGYASTAMGQLTTASGAASTAMGWSTKAVGFNSTAIGAHTTAESFASLAIGRYNTGFGNYPASWVDTDPLFEIGNGTSSSNKSNALTVLKNGKVGIGITPLTPLQIDGGTDANTTNGASGYLMIGSVFGDNLVFDTNEIMARNTVNPTTLFLQHNGGAVSVGGSVVHSSDRRLKRDIKPITYGLETVLELEPKSYYWKDRPDQKQRSLGLIAQEVQPIINELVLSNEKDDMLSVNYTELIPILIKAIQDQQEIIDSQNKKQENLTSRVAQLEAQNNQ